MPRIRIVVFTLIIAVIPILASCTPEETVAESVRTTVSETLVCELASKAIGSPVIYSPDLMRAAFITNKDDGKASVIDGISGKAYSEIYLDSGVFSPDSKRAAYKAMIWGKNPPADNRWFAVIDGEEGEEYQSVDRITFSPDSRHVAYIANGSVYLDRKKVETQMGSSISKEIGLFFSSDGEKLAFVINTEGKQSIAVNGVPGDMYDNIKNIVFSPDGEHLTYAAQDGNKWFVVTDDVPGKSYDGIESIVYSPDSRHIAYMVKEGTEKHTYFVVRDGVEGEKLGNKISHLVFSSDSSHLAYFSSLSLETAFKYQGFLVVDGVNTEITEGEIREFSFSPDGNRTAWVSYGYHWPSGSQYRIFTDGEETGKYEYIGDFAFSPDNQHIAYVCISGPKMFVTVDWLEGKIYESIGGQANTTSTIESSIKMVIFDSTNSFRYLVKKENGIYLVEEKLD